MRTPVTPAPPTPWIAAALCLCCVVASGCVQMARRGSRNASGASGPKVHAYRVDDATQAAAGAETSVSQATVHGARNEWVTFSVQLTGLPVGGRAAAPWYSLRLQPLRRVSSGGKAEDAQILPAEVEAYQIVSMPVDVNRAGYVRHTGSTTAVSDLPRALLPLPTNGGVIDLRALRPGVVTRQPQDPKPKQTQQPQPPPRVWIDMRLPADAPAGDFAATVELMQAGRRQPVATLPLSLTVYDFALPNERH